MWGEWVQHEFDQRGCRIRQAIDKSVGVDRESYARKISLITMSAHRRKHMSEILSAEEHSTLMAKRGELLATQSMIQLSAPLSLVDTSKTATGQSFKDLNRLVRQAHCEATDRFALSCNYGTSVCFVCCCVMGQQERFRFSMWISLCRNRGVTVGRKRCSLSCPISWHSPKCSRVAR